MRIIAVGQEAVGIVAIGQGAIGVIAVGQSALGVIAVGQLARGGIAVGQVAVGLVAVGQLAVGLLWTAGMLALGATAGPGLLVFAPFGRVYLRRRRREYRGLTPIGWALGVVTVLVAAGVFTITTAVPWIEAAAAEDGIFRVPPPPLR